MSDITDHAFRVAVDSDIIRIRPNTLVQLYISGTSTLVAEVLSDSAGSFSFSNIPTGKYDIRVEGQVVKTFHHISSIPDEQWVFFKSGAITADADAANNVQSYGSSVAGKIINVKLIAHYVGATGDVTVHLLKDNSSGATNLTVASDSVWSHQINPGSAVYRYAHEDSDPGITILANDVLQLGIDHTANSLEGLTVMAIFRPD